MSSGDSNPAALMNLFDRFQIDGGLLRLDESVLGPKVSRYLSTYLNLTTIDIREAVLRAPTDGRFVVSGTWRLFGGVPLRTTATFGLDQEGRPDIHLEAEPMGIGYRLTETFTGLDDGYLNLQVIHSARFTISTVGWTPTADDNAQLGFNPDETTNARLKGIAANWELSTAALMPNIPELLDGLTEKIRFEGAVRVHEGRVDFFLSSETPVLLGELPGIKSAGLEFITRPDSDEGTRVTGLRTTVVTRLGSQDTTLSALLPRLGREIILRGTFEDQAIPVVSAVRGLISDASMVEQLPTDLLPSDDIQLTEVAIGFDGLSWTALSFSFGVPSFSIIPGVDFTRVESADMAFTIRNPLSDSREFTARLLATISVFDVRFGIAVLYPGWATVAALSRGETIPITRIVSQLFNKLGLGWPEGIPQFDITTAEINIPGTRDSFFFRLAADDLELSTEIGSVRLAVRNPMIRWHRTPRKNRAPNDEVVLQFTTNLGTVEADVFGVVKTDGVTFRGNIRLDDPIPIVSLLNDVLPDELEIPEEFIGFDVEGGFLSFDTAARSFEVALKATAEVRLGDAAKFAVTKAELTRTSGDDAAWTFSLSGRMNIGDDFDAAGTMTVRNGTSGSEIAFVPDEENDPFEIPLPLPKHNGRKPALSVGLEAIRIGRSGKKWQFETAARIGFRNMYDFIAPALPTNARGALNIDGSNISLTISELFDAFSWTLPKIPAPNGGEIALGEMAFSASEFALSQDDGDFEIAVEFGFGLPSDLNKLFGFKENGQPRYEIFNTFDPAQPDESLVRVRLSASPRDGVRAVLLNSPLKSIKTREDENGDSWFDLDFGENGEISFLVPQFAFNQNAQSFAAAGGFRIVRPLKIPLRPIKDLFEAIGAGPLAGTLPDAIPIQDIKIFDDAGQLRTSELRALIGDSIDNEIGEAIDTIGRFASRLPDRFTNYLQFEVPESLDFEISVARGGDFRIHVAVAEGDPPLRFLFPGQVGILPGFNGVELHSLSVGDILSGQLFTVELDAVFDQFDIIGLGASLLLPGNQDLLPRSDDLHQTFEVRDLFMIVIYQTVIPIPIPVFYRKLGFDVLGFPGLGAGLSVAFPMPEGGITGLVRVLVDMVPFFSDPKVLLPDDLFDRHRLGITFACDAAYIELPKYLGGHVLGKKKDVFSLSISDAIVDTLNWFKRPTIAGLIKQVPIGQRVGAESISFGPVSIDAAWLVTTPDEFSNGAHLRIDVDDSQVGGALSIIPRGGEPADPSEQTEEGLVVFLRGGWNVASVFDMQAQFGLAAASEGFGTGFLLTGKMANVIDAELSGHVVIDRTATSDEVDSPAFRLQGHSHLTLFNHQFYTADIQMVDDDFMMNGRLDLFPTASPLTISGDVHARISKTQFEIQGGVSAELAGATLSGAFLFANKDRFHISATWLAVTTTLDATFDTGQVALHGTVDLDMVLDFSVGPIRDPFTNSQLISRIPIRTGFTGSLGANFDSLGFAGRANFGFVWQQHQLNVPEFSMRVAPSEVEAVGAEIIRTVKSNADAIFSQLFDSFSDWFKAGFDGTVQLVAKLRPALDAAKQWGDQAWDSIDSWSGTAWSSASNWGETGWNATTEWSDSAWRATSKWGDEAWRATTQWGDEAWRATTQWGEEAWEATSEWGEDAWTATTEWSDQAWRDTTQWSDRTWQQSTTWVASQWKNLSATLAGLHGDVALIPHLDGAITPHADFQAVPHGDFNAIPHGDVRFINHGDVRLIPHADFRAIPHADVKLIPHADFNAVPHVDVNAIPHADFFAVPHADFKVPPFGPHVDTPRTGHVDTPSTGHIDTPSTAHIDTPRTGHIDSPSTGHIDTPSTAHIDTPRVAHLDNAPTGHVDIAPTAHVDVPPQHGDSPGTAHIDTPS